MMVAAEAVGTIEAIWETMDSTSDTAEATGKPDTIDSAAERTGPTIGKSPDPAVTVGIAGAEPPRTSEMTLLTRETTVSAGADGTMEVTSATIESTLETAEEMGRAEIMDSTADKIGSTVGSPPAMFVTVGETGTGPSRMSDSTLLTTEATVSRGAEGTMEVISATTESRLEMTDESGRFETTDSTAEMMGSRPGNPPAVLVGFGTAGTEPSRRSDTMLLTTETTVSRGADGRREVISATIESAFETAEDTGSSETIDSTAEMIGSRTGSPAPGAAVLTGGLPLRISDTTELTTEAMVSTGADGTTDVTSDTIESAFDTSEAMGRFEAIDSTAEITGSRRPPPEAAVFVGAPSRMSETTELTIEAMVSTGADGTRDVTSATMESAFETSEETGRFDTIDSTAEITGSRTPPQELLCSLDYRRQCQKLQS